MRTISDTALGSAIGLAVLAALFVAIWVARDSSARVGVATVDVDAEAPLLQSVRTHRTPVTRTSVTPAQVRDLQAR